MRFKCPAQRCLLTAWWGGLLRGDWQNRAMTATEPSAARRAGSLHPVELAQASVMAALCAATAIIAVVVPFAAGRVAAGHRADGAARLPVPASGADRRDRRRRRDRVSDRRDGRIHDRRQLRLHRRADRHRQAARPRHPTVFVRGARRRRAVRRRHGGGARDPGAAAPPDLRLRDRQHQRARRGDRPHSRHGARRRAAQARLRHRAALLAVPVLRHVGAVHRHRHVHRLVGAVAGDEPTARDSRRAQARIVGRRRTDRPRAGPAARRSVPLPARPTTTPSARCR